MTEHRDTFCITVALRGGAPLHPEDDGPAYDDEWSGAISLHVRAHDLSDALRVAAGASWIAWLRHDDDAELRSHEDVHSPAREAQIEQQAGND